MKAKTIKVLAAGSVEDLQSNGPKIEEDRDTIADAKNRARYLITEEFAKTAECATMGYAQVVVNGECVADFFGD
jgi:hypothetical protein